MMCDAFADILDNGDEMDIGTAIRRDVVESIDFGDSTRGRLIPFSYYGGKYKHLHWLLSLLPQRKAYVEPFGGSGVVLLNREQSDVETFNDLYGEVVNFFRVLREDPERLFRKISLTPYSEKEFEIATEDETVSDVEQARRFFVVVNQSYNNTLENPSWSYNTAYSSRGVSKKVSNYQAKLRRLSPIADRLSGVQITSREAVDVVQTFDTEDGLIYCDPPYPESVRSSSDDYALEMNRSEHRELAEVLRRCEADVAVSSYQSDFYEDLFLDHGWNLVNAEGMKLSATPDGGGSERVESLYVNYEVTPEMLDAAF